ncbi:MAG: S1 family peptidase [Anaerolineae bacterium]|jgi:hypothetical protein|nr:S1 family peptidase [Anaerolineae bacterium]
MSSLLGQLLEAQRRFQLMLLAKAGVIGVGLGYRDFKGERTDELCLVALVEEKKPVETLRREDLVPRDLEGIKTDVLETGPIRAQNIGPRDRWRPLIPGGVSIGHYKVTAGTLGVLVRDKVTGEPLLLSNNHVLANSNDALIGDPILQPAALDRGLNPADVVARLERFRELRYVGDPVVPPPVSPPPPPPPPLPHDPLPIPDPNPNPNPNPGTGTPPRSSGCDIADLVATFGNVLARLNGSEKRLAVQSATAEAAPLLNTTGPTTVEAQMAIPDNSVDCALARPINPAMFSSDIRNIGRITGTRLPALGMRVRKTGRTTDTTEGVVNLVNATVDVGYSTARGPRTARFVGQVIASGMSQGGDSGSLIVMSGSQIAVGLLFAGSGVSTIFTPIDRVLDEMNIMF